MHTHAENKTKVCSELLFQWSIVSSGIFSESFIYRISSISLFIPRESDFFEKTWIFKNAASKHT